MTRCAGLLLAASCLTALTVGDHTLPDRLSIADREFSIRGGGTLYWRRLVSVYDAGLWIETANPAADPLAEVAKRIEFRYRRSIDASDLVKATNATFGRSLPTAEQEALAPALSRLNALYRDVRKNDALIFTYLPGEGTRIERGGDLVDTIPGAAFAKALFAIWLGPDPVDERFRNALLGTR